MYFPQKTRNAPFFRPKVLIMDTPKVLKNLSSNGGGLFGAALLVTAALSIAP